MAAFTAKATGNWSAAGQTTWNEVGVPGDGDTVTIGAFTVTVDVNTTVGTSPNDATTKVIDMTSATSHLVVSTGITLTVKGNIGAVNGSKDTVNGTLTFDASASGGTPVYTWINAGFGQHLGTNGTIQAVSGRTFAFDSDLSTTTYTGMTIRRCSNLTIGNLSGNLTLTDTLFDTCTQLNISSNSGTIGLILDRVEFLNGTHATGDLTISHSVAYTSGTRRISGCKLDKIFTNGGKGFLIENNYFGGGMTCVSSATVITPPRNNVFISDGLLNAGNGALIPFSINRNYHVIENAIGNPHFMAPTSLLGADNIVSQNIFEAQAPDLIDMGDCILLNLTACSGGNKIVGKNNIVIPGISGVSSGCLLTIFNAAAAVLFEAYRNTGNVNSSAVVDVGKRGMFAVAEGNTGTAGHVAALKSNIAWGSTAAQGYLGERVSGDVKDVITAANADRNWRHNVSAGDNQLGYEDRVASNTLWTAGDAVAAGVDANSGSGDPVFFDSARNIAKWCGARGHGAATYEAGKAALRADPTRAKDLINYVFEGHKPQNASCRTAAHDGGCVGAANYHKPTRSLAALTALRASRGATYGLTL